MVDVKKAFDSVSPHILSTKLSNYGFDGNACDLILSFMTNRDQYVDLNGASSSQRSINGGTPQGSLLGPILFSLFVNDLCEIPIFSDICLYADDTTLYISGPKLDVIAHKLVADLSLLNSWMRMNCLEINASKSELLHIRPSKNSVHLPQGVITIGDLPVARSPVIKFLGIHLDEEIKGSSYFEHLKRKLVGGVAALSLEPVTF